MGFERSQPFRVVNNTEPRPPRDPKNLVLISAASAARRFKLRERSASSWSDQARIVCDG